MNGLTESMERFIKLVNTGEIVVRDDGFYDRDGACKKVAGNGVISKTINGVSTTVQANRLMWHILRGPIPNGHQVGFKDGNKTNIHIDNLFLKKIEMNPLFTKKKDKQRQPTSSNKPKIKTKLPPETRVRLKHTKVVLHPILIETLRKRFHSGLISLEKVSGLTGMSIKNSINVMYGKMYASVGGPTKQFSTKEDTIQHIAVLNYSRAYDLYGISQANYQKIKDIFR